VNLSAGRCSSIAIFRASLVHFISTNVVIRLHHYLNHLIFILNPYFQAWTWQQCVPSKLQYQPVTLGSVKQRDRERDCRLKIEQPMELMQIDLFNNSYEFQMKHLPWFCYGLIHKLVFLVCVAVCVFWRIFLSLKNMIGWCIRVSVVEYSNLSFVESDLWSCSRVISMVAMVCSSW
jgi:hypothetical protein